MFIQAQMLSDKNLMEFIPGAIVYSDGPLEIRRNDKHRSTMASRLFAIEGVLSMVLMPDRLVVEKSEGSDWSELKTSILGAMMQHYKPGDSSVTGEDGGIPESASAAGHPETRFNSGLNSELGLAVSRVLDQQINPAVIARGGRISLVNVAGDKAYVRREGHCLVCKVAKATLKNSVAKKIMAQVPQITEIVDVTENADDEHR